jgi:hypothetical protein
MGLSKVSFASIALLTVLHVTPLGERCIFTLVERVKFTALEVVKFTSMEGGKVRLKLRAKFASRRGSLFPP